MKNLELSTNNSVSVVEKSPIILEVGYTCDSNESLVLNTISPLTFLSIFCFVQLNGLKFLSSTPCKVYKLVSTSSDAVIE